MPVISERNLSIFISLLSVKIRDMKVALEKINSATDEPSEEQVQEEMALQEALEQYILVRDAMREEHEIALKQGLNSPSYEALTGEPGAS